MSLDCISKQEKYGNLQSIYWRRMYWGNYIVIYERKRTIKEFSRTSIKSNLQFIYWQQMYWAIEVTI